MTTEAVLATLDEYARTYCAKDIDGLMAVFDERGNISVIGTGADEICVGRDQVKELFLRNFSEAKANRFEWHWKDISIMNDHAVVAVKLSIHLDISGNALQVPVRWTVVLRRQNGHWVWLHRHASIAASGQSEGQAYPQSEQ
jgi:ketosteroid isomerase-like protein